MDREKVAKGLHQHCECSLFDRCGECPYYETDYESWGESNFKCRDRLLCDAFILSKEQEAVEPRVSTAEQRCGHCNKVIEMDGWIACPWCGKRIDWERWWSKNGNR